MDQHLYNLTEKYMFGVNLIETGAAIKMLGLSTQTYRHFLKPLF